MQKPQEDAPGQDAPAWLDGSEDRKQASDFWTPDLGGGFVGKLDGVDTNRFGDVARFRAGVALFSPKDSKTPSGYRRTLSLALSANLASRITAADSGKYFFVRFDEWFETPNGKARNFTVKIPEQSRCAAMVADAKVSHPDDLSF